MTKSCRFYCVFMTLLLAFMARPVSAWEVYDHSTPYDNEILDQNPYRVQIYFSEMVAFRQATMTDANGKPVPIKYAMPEEDTNAIEIWTPPDLAPGSYAIHWFVFVTDHGHVDSGDLRFTIKAP